MGPEGSKGGPYLGDVLSSPDTFHSVTHDRMDEPPYFLTFCPGFFLHTGS